MPRWPMRRCVGSARAQIAAGPAAALRRDFGAGRLAWIAIGPDAGMPTEADRRHLRRLLEAAVAWTSRTPWVEVLPWPGAAPFAAIVEAGALDFSGADDPADAWQREIEAAEADGGLARLRVPESARHHDSIERRLAATIGELDRRGAWVATRSENATWTRQRSAVKASVRRAGPRRVLVEVTNFGRSTASRVMLRLFLNEPVRRAEVKATKLLQDDASVRLAPDAEVLDLVLPDLAARASAAFSLDYEPVASSQDG